MIKIIDSEDYYLYLIDRVGLEGVEERAYSLLFHELYKTEFMWSNPMDENRALDGTDLRRQYTEETGEVLPEAGPCSMLEMFVALAIRCEEEFMRTGDDNNSRLWFWDIIYNLGLERYDDYRFNIVAVQRILKNVIFRRYSANGNGGMFPLRHATRDQREVEIWYQMSAWLQENYE